MANYFVGDVQGCLAELKRLLDRVQFDPNRDRLWACGDLVARGPDSLGVLRLFRQLGDAATTVLGNHDLHLFAVAAGLKRSKPRDNLSELLDAPDRDDLLNWLRRQPLMHYLSEHKLILTHAGVPPHWDLTTMRQRADEVSNTLRQEDYLNFIAQMYGDKPDRDDSEDRLIRQTYTVNALTRMRFLHHDGRLDFDFKTSPEQAAPLIPWFKFQNHQLLQDHRVVFGHWASLMGLANHPNVIALDTGCCWGNRLSLWRLEDDHIEQQQALS